MAEQTKTPMPVYMELGIYLPSHVFRKEDMVEKIVAEGMEGYFTLLPRHVDYVSVLVPGILTIITSERQFLFAVDQGTLVKQGHRVRIATRNCVEGENLETLAQLVHEKYLELDDMERKVRTALTGLEHAMIRRFAELKKV